MNEINIKDQPEAKSAIECLKERFPARLFSYESRTIPRIATMIDPRFKKEGFLSVSNAEQASKALEDELSLKMSKAKRISQPTPTTPEPVRFSFMKNKLQSKVSTSKSSAIIILRQHLENSIAPEECNPLEYWKVR